MKGSLTVGRQNSVRYTVKLNTLNGMLCKTYLSMRVCIVSSKENSLQCVEYKPNTIGQNFLNFFLYGKQQQQYDNSFQAATGSL